MGVGSRLDTTPPGVPVRDTHEQEEEVGTKNINHPDHEGTSPRDMEDTEVEGGKWVLGGSSEENERYRALLKYCEEMREEKKRQISEDEGRKAEARRKEHTWSLLKESIRYLRENEVRGQHRKIVEIERIKAEERQVRLAIISEKRKRYGIKKMSKDENLK